MAVDKKVLDGQLRLVLMRDVGESVISAEFDTDTLRQTLDAA
jgi:3-dehydroquinate synthase